MSVSESPVATLAVRNLTTAFKIDGAWHAAVRGISFDIAANETLCLVGESGCGKSITALSTMRLIEDPGRTRVTGEILFEGRDLLALPERTMRTIRGSRIAMIFQEPMSSLNPVLSVGRQVAEPLIAHMGASAHDAKQAALALLAAVRIPDPQRRYDHYPFELSGGMRQRVMIAMALACRPSLIVADEPTTALDVTIQAEVLALLREFRRQHGLAMLFITHDLGVVARMADRVAVMYAGELVETGPVARVLGAPEHPYTQALLRSIPRVDRDVGPLQVIPGQVPPMTAMPRGCSFAARCGSRMDVCDTTKPQLAPSAGSGHCVRCLLRQSQHSTGISA